MRISEAPLTVNVFPSRATMTPVTASLSLPGTLEPAITVKALKRFLLRLNTPKLLVAVPSVKLAI